MPKPIQTFLGTATLYRATFSSTKARLTLSVPGIPGSQTITARRKAPAREPNTWQWSVGGFRNHPFELVIAPTSRDAIHQYLCS